MQMVTTLSGRHTSIVCPSVESCMQILTKLWNGVYHGHETADHTLGVIWIY